MSMSDIGDGERRQRGSGAMSGGGPVVTGGGWSESGGRPAGTGGWPVVTVSAVMVAGVAVETAMGEVPVATLAESAVGNPAAWAAVVGGTPS